MPSEGYIYVRQEYPLAVENVTHAIEQAEAHGFLGKNILGSGFDFSVKVHRGAGAFVCGESTALMTALEGRAGEPRPKYVRSNVKGLWGKPSVLNNVETWANVPLIINHGADWFAADRNRGQQGHQDLLAGRQDHQHRSGGSADGHHPAEDRLRDRRRRARRQEVQGGADRRPVRRLHPRGAPGSCRSASTSSPTAGSMMGSGGMIVMDEDTCMVDVARYFTGFLTDESCGKCVPCREGPQADAPAADQDLRRRGAAERPRDAEGSLRARQRGLALRARQERARRRS